MIVELNAAVAQTAYIDVTAGRGPGSALRSHITAYQLRARIIAAPFFRTVVIAGLLTPIGFSIRRAGPGLSHLTPVIDHTVTAARGAVGRSLAPFRR